MKPIYHYVIILIFSFLFVEIPHLNAQPGRLDSSFGRYGIVIQDIAGKNDYGFATAIQPDGKILTAGFGFIDTVTYNDFVLIRYKANGELDSSFGTYGMSTTDFGGGGNDQAMSMCLQPDGKIILAGKSFAPGRAADFALARYNNNGILDSSFGTAGSVTTDIAGYNDYGSCVKLQRDGKIVMTGYTYDGTNTALAVVRYNTNGTLDNAFDLDGIAIIRFGDIYLDGQSLVIQNDGKIVASATVKVPTNEYNIFVARLNTNGGPDSTFDNDGTVNTDFCYTDNAYSVAVQHNGKIIAAGASNDTVNIAMGKNVMLIRYNANGSIDSSFGKYGKVNTEVTDLADIVYATVIQSDGKIIAIGHSSDGVTQFKIILMRYRTNGVLDSSFGTNGLVTTDIAYMHEFGEAVALQRDGNIVVTGFVNNGTNFNMFTARYIGDIPNSVVSVSPLTSIKLFPNPCKNDLYVELPENSTDLSISLFDITGQIIKEVNHLNSKAYHFDCSEIPDGVYILRVSTIGLGTYRQTVVVSK